MELGPEVFAEIIIWRLVSSGPIVYFSLLKVRRNAEKLRVFFWKILTH